MNVWKLVALVGVGYLLCTDIRPTAAQEIPTGRQQTQSYTYEKNIALIVKTYCMSCHGSDNENPSELYMDDFATLMKGGKHGTPVVAGKPNESPLYFKLLTDPPFGKQMPRGRKKITPEAIKMIHDWIKEGAREK